MLNESEDLLILSINDDENRVPSGSNSGWSADELEESWNAHCDR